MDSRIVSYPTRPDFGSNGRLTEIKANFFPVLSLPKLLIHQYNVQFVPETTSRTARKLFANWVQISNKKGGILENILPVYDGKKTIFTSAPIPLVVENFVVELPQDEEYNSSHAPPRFGTSGIPGIKKKSQTFTLVIRKIGEIDTQRLIDFLNPTSSDKASYFPTPYDVIMALDVVLRFGPLMTTTKFATVGRSFFSYEGSQTISGGAELWRGFHQSLRPTQGRLLLNLDVSATAFYEAGPLIDVVTNILGKRSPDDLRMFNEKDRMRLEKVLMHVKVHTVHRGSQFDRRKWRISGLTTTPANRTMFELRSDGREISVEGYFKWKYSYSLRYPHLPCLIVGDEKKSIWFPMEVCNIVKGQRILKKLNDAQTADVIKFTCQQPTQRSSQIMQGFSLLHGNQPTPEMRNFGIQLGPEMATIPARVLPTPTVSYHPSSADAIVHPEQGCWNLKNRKVANGAVILAWSIVVFGRESEIPLESVMRFTRDLVVMGRDTGIDIRNDKPGIRLGNPNGNIESILKAAYIDAAESVSPPSKPQLILCVLPNSGMQLYAEIKRVSDTVIGIATQCVLSKRKFFRLAISDMAINVKLGGMNAYLGTQQLPFVAERPTMLFGADVTHPSPSERDKPSIAACVGSMDAQCSRYASSIRVQKGRKEIIQELGSMVMELLRTFYQFCGSKPERIIFYRDGVSEGQFAEVVREEVGAILNACNEIEEGYQPTLTFIIVQKRHHARFFPLNSGDKDRTGNVLPGTVVDSGITHPREFDFYLASHPGLQGTSKPTHYHVLWDSNNFGADALQELTYRLCYLYCRATRAVSVCPPAYYAHLVAARARFHFQGNGWASNESDDGIEGVERPSLSSLLPSDLGIGTLIGDYGISNVSGSGDTIAEVKPDLQKVMFFIQVALLQQANETNTRNNSNNHHNSRIPIFKPPIELTPTNYGVIPLIGTLDRRELMYLNYPFEVEDPNSKLLGPVPINGWFLVRSLEQRMTLSTTNSMTNNGTTHEANVTAETSVPFSRYMSTQLEEDVKRIKLLYMIEGRAVGQLYYCARRIGFIVHPAVIWSFGHYLRGKLGSIIKRALVDQRLNLPYDADLLDIFKRNIDEDERFPAGTSESVDKLVGSGNENSRRSSTTASKSSPIDSNAVNGEINEKNNTTPAPTERIADIDALKSDIVKEMELLLSSRNDVQRNQISEVEKRIKKLEENFDKTMNYISARSKRNSTPTGSTSMPSPSDGSTSKRKSISEHMDDGFSIDFPVNKRHNVEQ
ncbi:hypothetical protein HK098_001687 [Nowakowskiella sp. JEL0407]|nr:hypothetical protein HK098_001687 [Nowakowskiella sp. JEL0407]